MDLNVLRSLMTVVSLMVFLGIVAWAWGARRRSQFDEAADLPFMDDAAAHASSRASAELSKGARHE